MTSFRLVLNSLLFHWRTHLAVLLGVIAGTAVIGGALIVGDSVRESLKTISLKRLGQVDFAVQSPRFFRESLAAEISDTPEFQKSFSSLAPALSMTAGLQRSADERIHRANRVGFWGVDERFWPMIAPDSAPVPQDRDIVLGSETAKALEAKVGDPISVWVELPTSIPRDSLLGDREKTSQELSYTVSAILDQQTTASRFRLNPSQQMTLNAYVSLEELQYSLELGAVRSRTGGEEKPARVNALFASAGPAAETDAALGQSDELSKLIRSNVTLEDLSLRLRPLDNKGYVALESEQMILDPTAESAGRAAAEKMDSEISSVLVYLANELANAGELEKFSMYSVLAGVDRNSLNAKPFGPVTMIEGEWPKQMTSDEIVLNDWVAEDLQVHAGDKIRIKWHEVGSHGELPEIERFFTVKGIVKFEETPVDDQGFTPSLPGVTDVNTFSEWKKPFEMDEDRITDRDHEYWSLFRATPKGFLSLEAAKELWKSRYGNLTSIRFAPPEESSLADFTDSLRSAIPASIEPREAGLAVLPVKYQGLQAAQGTTDFSGLFIGFSFFLILSAMILIGLLFRLGIQRRVSSIGLLNAVGLHEKQVRRLMGSEALIVVVVGSLLGAVASVEYARLMIYGLTTWWVGAIGTSELELFVSPVSLVTGCLIAVFVAAVAVWWSLRRLKGHSVRALLAGNFEEDSRVSDSSGRPKKIAIVSACIGGVLLVLVGAGLFSDNEAFAGLSWKVVMFFVVGMLCLTAFLNGLSVWIARDRLSAVQGHGFAALGHLAVRNVARNRSRSVFTVGLISSATFVIVAVAAGHRNPAVETPDFNSGNGGFRLIAESSQPILFDLNSEEGRRKLQLDQATDAEASALWKKTAIVSFRHKPGDDASCLNLYQTKLPTILGATERMIERGGFKFVGTSSDNPWAVLNEQLPEQDGVPVYPVFGDMNTLQYSLHKGVGDRIPVPNEETPEAWLEIAGMFDGSIFQGVLVASEESFFKMFPEQQGFSWFLIGSNEPRQAGLSRADADKLSGMLETGLDAYGFDVDRVADRLDAFLKVQNTYLTTFQTLGGLGLLLGTIGLGTVMLRNVVERRSELSLLRAVGFRNRSVGSLVVWENLFLLCWGLVSGTVSALLAMTPHLVSTGADVPWRSGLLLLAGVFATGMLSVVFAVRQAVHTPVLSTLRGE